MEIAIDFDGTCVTHAYPEVGRDIGAVRVLKRLVDNGHKLILYTMRSGGPLEEAENWFRNNGIMLYSSQVNPNQSVWTNSPKCYAQLYIDDAALGIPLIVPVSERSYVDWIAVEKLLMEKKLLKFSE